MWCGPTKGFGVPHQCSRVNKNEVDGGVCHVLGFVSAPTVIFLQEHSAQRSVITNNNRIQRDGTCHIGAVVISSCNNRGNNSSPTPPSKKNSKKKKIKKSAASKRGKIAA